MKIHLRYYHPHGGSKDWFAEVSPEGLIIRFGKTDATLQTRFIPAHQCYMSPTQEARIRANKKMAKGYMLVKEEPSLAAVAPTHPEQPRHPVAEKRFSVSSVLQEWEQENTENWF